MAKIEPFEKYSEEYDNWFVRHKKLYQLELKAVKSFIPDDKKGVEIGVGSARFAEPLDIKNGVEPSKKIASIAEKRGINVYNATAEHLPFDDETFDFALLVTTICFVDDILKTFQETYRILKKNGSIIVGFIDKNSKLGKKYQTRKMQSRFYKHAIFYSVEDVKNFLKQAKFEHFSIKQTIFPDKRQKIEEGYGKGSFIVIKALKKNYRD